MIQVHGKGRVVRYSIKLEVQVGARRAREGHPTVGTSTLDAMVRGSRRG